MKPFIAKFVCAQEKEACSEIIPIQLEYNVKAESRFIKGSEHKVIDCQYVSIELTGSLTTRQFQDPTQDEPTDR
jgi:hypothetical protein